MPSLGSVQRTTRHLIFSEPEVRAFVELHSLMGQGLGWVDVHLLAAAFASGHRLWTRDRHLARAAERLGVTH